MENLLVQLFAGIIIVILGWISFRKYPFKLDTKNMILVSLFVVIATILSVFVSIKLPLFGVDSLRIGFAQLVLVIGGSLVVPGYAFLMGLIYDLLGLIISPTTPFLGFTLNSILACLIPSFWYHKKRQFNMNLLTNGLLVLLGAGAILYFITTPTVKIDDVVIEMNTSLKISASLFCAGVSMALILVLAYVRKKSDINSLELSNFIFVCVMIEIVIQFICTPVWLQVMWNVPWSASLFVRIIKAIVMIPLNVTIGSITLRALKR